MMMISPVRIANLRMCMRQYCACGHELGLDGEITLKLAVDGVMRCPECDQVLVREQLIEKEDWTMQKRR